MKRKEYHSTVPSTDHMGIVEGRFDRVQAGRRDLMGVSGQFMKGEMWSTSLTLLPLRSNCRSRAGICRDPSPWAPSFSIPQRKQQTWPWRTTTALSLRPFRPSHPFPEQLSNVRCRIYQGNCVPSCVELRAMGRGRASRRTLKFCSQPTYFASWVERRSSATPEDEHRRGQSLRHRVPQPQTDTRTTLTDRFISIVKSSESWTDRGFQEQAAGRQDGRQKISNYRLCPKWGLLTVGP